MVEQQNADAVDRALASVFGILKSHADNSFLAQDIGAVFCEVKAELCALRDMVADLEKQTVGQARTLRFCGIKVARFAGLHGTIKNYKGSDDPYNPETVVDLIEDILSLAKEEIGKQSKELADLRTEREHLLARLEAHTTQSE